MTEPLLVRAQVIERLNVSYDWFCRHRQDLEAVGFPKPLPGFPPRSGARWDPAAIDEWIASHKPPRIRVEGAESLSDEELDQLLEGRTGQIAGSLTAAE